MTNSPYEELHDAWLVVEHVLKQLRVGSTVRVQIRRDRVLGSEGAPLVSHLSWEKINGVWRVCWTPITAEGKPRPVVDVPADTRVWLAAYVSALLEEAARVKREEVLPGLSSAAAHIRSTCVEFQRKVNKEQADDKPSE